MVLLLLVAVTQNPLVVHHVLVDIAARLQLESSFVIFVDFGKHQLRLGSPVIPAANYKHLFGSRDPLGLIAEGVRLDFQSRCTLQHIFEFPYDLPLWFPVILSLVVEQFDLFCLT